MPQKKNSSSKKGFGACIKYDEKLFSILLVASLTAILVGSGVYWFISLTNQTKNRQAINEKTNELNVQVEILKEQVQNLKRDLILEKRKAENEESALIEEPKNMEKEEAYVVSLYESNGSNYIDVDFVFWLTGEEAIEAAIEDTGCTREIITEGRCAPTLANGYYVRNQFSDLTTLAVPQDASIELLTSGIRPTKVTFEEFIRLYSENKIGYYSDAVYNIYTVDGEVVRIAQQYQP